MCSARAVRVPRAIVEKLIRFKALRGAPRVPLVCLSATPPSQRLRKVQSRAARKFCELDVFVT
jgi:hypothetical protein